MSEEMIYTFENPEYRKLFWHTSAHVMAQADISSATLSRVSRCVQYGNGYAKVLKGK